MRRSEAKTKGACSPREHNLTQAVHERITPLRGDRRPADALEKIETNQSEKVPREPRKIPQNVRFCASSLIN